MTINLIALVVGVLINIFIGKIGKFIFRKDDKTTRVILRIIGIFLIISAVSSLFMS